MLNPITASENIKKRYEDYISTNFSIADKEYNALLRKALKKEDLVAKGPYLDINDSFQTSKSINELIDSGELTPLLRSLEKCEEGKKELPIKRSLYRHQEEAILKSNRNHNLIITTGTGSGKTECFLLPILQSLLKEIERNELDPGVRAMIIYPMNALANDQLKRLRALLKDSHEGASRITFGVYNGSTRHTQVDAVNNYGQLHKDEYGHAMAPLPNEIISREQMQQTPPNILITNYAMLEYMMLRPKDDAVFTGSKLKYIVLDEAHIYKGATGMEMSLLMRRVRARISKPQDVQYILTSATLGDKSVDNEIASFGRTLCNAPFTSSDIIRSVHIKHEKPSMLRKLPLDRYSAILYDREQIDDLLKDWQVSADINASFDEKVFEMGLNDDIFHELRRVVSRPMTVTEIASRMGLTSQNIIDVISLYVHGEKNKVNLMKARYHTLIRALEGAYITLTKPKELFLHRRLNFNFQNQEFKVFEAAVCDDCGRLAICGEIKDNKLEQSASRWDKTIEYFILLEEESEENFLDEESETDGSIDSPENLYLVCSKCGTIGHPDHSNNLKCKCGKEYYVAVRKSQKNKSSGVVKCPACNYGEFKSFYLGNEAATSVLATSLFEELPQSETYYEYGSTIVDDTDPFAVDTHRIPTVKNKDRQFLCFSDSRSEAAFFACYMSKSYQEFLRRRGIWHVVNANKASMTNSPWEIKDFINELTAYFDENRTFAEPGDNKGKNLTSISRKHAWIALLNEMYNARRNTSLTSLGLLSFEYKGNSKKIVNAFANKMKMDYADAKALLDLLVMDIVFYGAIQGEHNLQDADREYIFYAAKPKMITQLKTELEKSKTYLSSWMARSRVTGTSKFFKNSRLIRMTKTLQVDEDYANDMLCKYWKSVLIGGEYPLTLSSGNEYFIKTDKLTIKAHAENEPLYKCNKCGRITRYNCKKQCISVKCSGSLEPVLVEDILQGNHYFGLYSNEHMSPLHIKEHTAQLGREEQEKYQLLFVEKKINALSCSTTFEMGVDVGSLETIYLRNVPPSPANYVQRAGRAGRTTKSAAFCLMYAKLSSHDFTYFDNPISMISGKIGVPKFTVENEKVVLRHIFAVALSHFFSITDVYDNNNANKLLNENGFYELKSYLAEKPSELRVLLEKSIPENLSAVFDIKNFGWTEKLIGEDGILTIAVNDFKNTVEWYEKAILEFKSTDDLQRANFFNNRMKDFRRNNEDKRGKNDLIEFLVRNNVLPKYGFPVDTVELHQNINYNPEEKRNLQMARDLQLAISEYAPGSQVVADGKLFTSRYIRKMPNQASARDWEYSYIAECTNPVCKTTNFLRVEPNDHDELRCIACNQIIEKKHWQKNIEPRKGFITEKSPLEDVPMRRPEHSYRSDDFYIGDKERKQINEWTFAVNGNKLQVQSTINDSLVVVCDDSFFVCEWCGYTESYHENADDRSINPFKPKIVRKHESPFGRECGNRNLNRVKLSHTFKTDVVKIVFDHPNAKDNNTMLSVLYALLEGISRELEIERTDIKGCIQKVLSSDGVLVNALYVYDSVAGGAGHVRRLVTEDGYNLTKVISRAMLLTDQCECDPSCYKCLRNYYNQKIHDLLNRKLAFGFLSNYQGRLRNTQFGPETSYTSSIKPIEIKLDLLNALRIPSDEKWSDWDYMFPDEYSYLADVFDEREIPLADLCGVTLSTNNQNIGVAAFVWRKEKILLLESQSTLCDIVGWKCIDILDFNIDTFAEYFI